MRTPPLGRLLLAGLTLTLLAPALSGCGKNDGPPREVMPPVTQTGANKAGALVDGVIWLPMKGVLFGTPAMRAFVYRQPGQPTYELSLGFSRQAPEGNEQYYDYPDSSIRLYLPSVVPGPGTYELNQAVSPPFPSDEGRHGVLIDRTTQPDTAFPTGTGPANNGQLVITRFDTVARVVAGTFEFTGQRGAQLVKVTQGRFDVTY